MDRRVAVNLAGRCLEDLASQALGKAQHVDRAVHRRLGRLHRIVLVMDRGGRAGQIVDLIDLQIERKGHVVADELEPGVAEQMLDILLRSCEQVVDANDLVTVRQ